MKTLLSLPINVVSSFHHLTRTSSETFFCTSDPIDKKLGSGAGTIWLLRKCYEQESNGRFSFEEWLCKEKRILLHAGGQSRRLPAYAPSGKILTPMPIFRWERGQKLSQTLLDLQLPLYEKISKMASKHLHTLIASGDVYIRTTQALPKIPSADIVCYGLWASPEEISQHGVFMLNRQNPEKLDFMLQKPSIEKQADYMHSHYALMDIGIWLLSDKAIEALHKKSIQEDSASYLQPNAFTFYDLYSQFGCALGEHPSSPDPDLTRLSIAIIPLEGAEFYHLGTGPELLSSSSSIENIIEDQRLILKKGIEKNNSLFTLNSLRSFKFNHENQFIWIENSILSKEWALTHHHIITGVPENHSHINLKPYTCIDIIPIRSQEWAVRPYGYFDRFNGNINNDKTLYMGIPFKEWAKERKIPLEIFKNPEDIQKTDLFPVIHSLNDLEEVLQFMLNANGDGTFFKNNQRISAEEISTQANLVRLFQQKELLQCHNANTLAKKWKTSIFYQMNLKDTAKYFAPNNLPEVLPESADLNIRIHDSMFRSEVYRQHNLQQENKNWSNNAFHLLSKEIVTPSFSQKVIPHSTTQLDQIVWGRSPARIDLAGGWSDTPPYSMMEGGNVVNIAIKLNGQKPLQVFIKPSASPVIICRSIDLGASEVIKTYADLGNYHLVGSPFSIPKAALCLCGFSPLFCAEQYNSLEEQLKAFGYGLEITLLSAIPAGSGLGISSILAATVLGALNNFCGLGWSEETILHRTLILEQLLTTGGGWQDQYGGVYSGIKLLQSSQGIHQKVIAQQLPATFFTDTHHKACHLLYYTGITRVAKNILTEIVRGMFLNDEHIPLLREMKQHALEVAQYIYQNHFESYGKSIRKTWEQNKALDRGTNPDIIEYLCKQIDDLCLGYKLPGAGGGGFMYMVAKDEKAAKQIKKRLLSHPIQPNARFVEMDICQQGLEISRS